MSDETIVVWYKSLGQISHLESHYHKYIVYTDKDGNKFYARGGPSQATQNQKEDFTDTQWWGGNNFGYIRTDHGVYEPGTPDWDREIGQLGGTVASGADLSEEWAAVVQAMDDIESELHTYRPTSHNSNSAVDEALERAGLNPAPHDDTFWSPGSDTNLPETGGNWLPDMDGLPLMMPGAYVPFNNGKTKASPLVLDLDSDGVELTDHNAATTTTFFDIDNDGFAEQTAWVGADDGLLARDVSGNGFIDDASELFGSATVDGFAILAELDSNGDLVIDANDAAWSELVIWKDANGDAFSQTSELTSLGSYNIVSIDLAGVSASTQTIAGNPISHESTFKYSNGSTGDIVDAWFVHDNINTYFTGEYALAESIMYLPTLRGYGTVAALHIRMSEDSSLLENVNELAAEWSFASFADNAAMNADIEDILFKWAGVDGVATDSRGPNVDARHLEFLEELFGEEWLQNNAFENPYYQAGQNLEESWEIVFAHFKAQLIFQSGGFALFDNTAHYDPPTGTISGALNLVQSAIDDLETEASAPGVDAEVYWLEVAGFLEHSKGLSNLTATEEGWLEAAVSGSDPNLSWQDIEDVYLDSMPDPDGVSYWGTYGDDVYDGTAFDDTLNGIHGNDLLYGHGGDDIVKGGYGNDTLYGGSGNDVLWGQRDDDILSPGDGGDYAYGDLGYDTYVYTGGDDVYYDRGHTDKIQLPQNVTLSDLSFYRVNNYDLLIQIDGHGSIQIEKQINSQNGAYAIESIEFYDQSTLSLTTLTGLVTYGSEGNDTNLQGIYSGADQNDVIYALGGDDNISARNGNDIIDGGSGNDTINGQGGDDVIIASPGYDTVTGGGGFDAIRVPLGYSPQDLSLVRLSTDASDLHIFITGLGQIEVTSQFATPSGPPIDEIVFEDGSNAIDITTLTIETLGTDGNDSISGIEYGASTDDILRGFAGNDNLNSGTGDDIIYGGDGNDTIDGSNDDDTLYGDAGDDNIKGGSGNDIIYGGEGSDSLYGESTTGSYVGDDVLYGDAGNDYLDGRYGNDVLYGGADDDTLMGNDGDDILYGDAGVDTLNGAYGADTFVFEAATAFSGNDTIQDFSTSQNDAIDISDLLTGYDPLTDDITDFVMLGENTNDSYMHVDSDGTGTGIGFRQILTIQGVNGLGTVQDLIDDGNLIVQQAA